MAALFKQRLIKAGRDFNYAEGVKVLAGEAITAGQIVAMSGYSGPFLTVVKADRGAASDTAKRCGRLLIAKHDIPANGYGVCLPWQLVTGFDTSAAGTEIGEPVYLSTSGTATLVPGAAATQRIVGSVVHVAAADAATPGAWMFSGELDFGALEP